MLAKRKDYSTPVSEDEDINFEFPEVLLNKESDDGYKILSVINGEEALQACRKWKDIDLVLMDIRMPVMNGHEASRINKSEFPHIPIIAQTAYAT
ncbi:MAG: response regulator [Cryomorphaceae bacterium]